MVIPTLLNRSMTSSTSSRIDAFVDTSAFIAALVRPDIHHDLFARLFSKPPRLITSALVVAEGYGYFLRRYDQHRAMQFLAMVRSLDRHLRIVPFDANGLESATQVLQRFGDQKLTVTDAHGLALMERHSLELCWSTDWHMGLSGASLAIH